MARWAVATARMKSRNEALDSVSTIAGWLAETGSWPQGLTRARRSDLDRPGAPYVGAPNGVINLETRQVLTGAAAREKLVTRTLLDPYDETAKHPAVDQLLSHLTPENREWLLGAAGWGLRGNPARRFYFLEGLGNDGKTTLFNALLETLGDYAAPPMSNSMFNGGRNGERPDAPMAYLKTFQEVPLVFIAEPPKNGFNWELARTVSGSDTTNARQIRGKLDVLRKRRYISTLFLCTNPDTLSQGSRQWLALVLFDLPRTPSLDRRRNRASTIRGGISSAFQPKTAIRFVPANAPPGHWPGRAG